ncbi:TIGR03032 family protein [Microbulbifer hydrolyticus]|uniref:TIGR03032 family protein n=1 Tax=Microbulbifer hydrolyticus TaxID=48074 RepID=A0ABX6IVX3_9GAMM|nr:TIGR03032 family protein [Microbulbifer hydrolyticus]QHQ37677.1 TIGR03032 family protein [Microbulbifer hydrolyticus]
MVGAETGDRLCFDERSVRRVSAVAGNRKRLYLGGHYQLCRFENVLQPDQVANKIYDACYVARNAQFTGELGIHDLGVKQGGKLVFVNTAYNCLAEPSVTHSFRAIWKPDFISALVREDRCHLSGVAMVNGRPKYVTAASKSDSDGGWREHRDNGGIIIDVETNEIVCEGLSLPNSPRWHNGRLWVLNSGTGDLGYVDFESRRFVAHTFCPGFMRGLAIHGDYAIVGLSRPRDGRFEGLALDQNLADRDCEVWCGIQFINLGNGNVEHWIRLDGAVTELFGLTALPGVRCPMGVSQQGSASRAMITFEDKSGDGPQRQCE